MLVSPMLRTTLCLAILSPLVAAAPILRTLSSLGVRGVEPRTNAEPAHHERLIGHEMADVAAKLEHDQFVGAPIINPPLKTTTTAASSHTTKATPSATPPAKRTTSATIQSKPSATPSPTKVAMKPSLMPTPIKKSSSSHTPIPTSSHTPTPTKSSSVTRATAKPTSTAKSPAPAPTAARNAAPNQNPPPFGGISCEDNPSCGPGTTGTDGATRGSGGYQGQPVKKKIVT